VKIKKLIENNSLNQNIYLFVFLQFNFNFFSFLLVFLYFYINLHVYTLFVPAPSPTLPGSLQILVHPLVLRFCWRENIGDNEKDISFLLVWDKGNSTERFLVLLPCTCVSQSMLVRLYQISSLLPGPLPIVISANLRLLYSLLNREHINHIKVLGILSYPYFSCMHSPLSVWPMSNNITAFVLGL
jgi:hypothetical protein